MLGFSKYYESRREPLGMIAARPTYDRAITSGLGWIREPRKGPEEAVVRLWQNADGLADGLVTQDGARLKVLYPGRRSSSAGPDFRDCVLSNESGEVIIGDVEVHVAVSGWSAHRHHVDPNYNGVVLHVVLKQNGAHTTSLQSKVEVPVAVIEHFPEVLDRDEERSTLDRHIAPIVDIHSKLDSAGDTRFRSKADGFAIEIGIEEPEQVLYAGMMEALGYSANRKPFAALAKALPIARLRALRHEPAATRLLSIRAMLISAAGLMSSVSPEDTQKIRDLLRHLPQVKKIDEPWKTFRVRPANHPIRRVEGAALIIDRSVDQGLIASLAATLRSGDHRLVTSWLEAPPFVGRNRAQDITINIVLPFMYAWGGIKRDLDLQRRSLEIFRKTPSLAENEITREMKRLLPDGIDTRGARRQQGLIYLYKNMRGLWGEGKGPIT
jgi:hypothetical protein